jgi:hypothetical protein
MLSFFGYDMVEMFYANRAAKTRVSYYDRPSETYQRKKRWSNILLKEKNGVQFDRLDACWLVYVSSYQLWFLIPTGIF